jgi:hypothetical protein
MPRDELGRVIILVGTDGATGLGIIVDHVERSHALCRAVGFRHPGIDDESVAILRHEMSHVAELRLFADRFAKQSSIGVGCRGMRIIRAFLATEVALGIASSAHRRWTAAVFSNEALHASPRLDQRAVH